MQAEIVDLAARFEVQPALREDGTTGPPYRVSISMRPCWRKPPVRVELTLLDEVGKVAYYGVGESQAARQTKQLL